MFNINLADVAELQFIEGANVSTVTGDISQCFDSVLPVNNGFDALTVEVWANDCNPYTVDPGITADEIAAADYRSVYGSCEIRVLDQNFNVIPASVLPAGLYAAIAENNSLEAKLAAWFADQQAWRVEVAEETELGCR